VKCPGEARLGRLEVARTGRQECLPYSLLPGAVIRHDCVIGNHACVASSVSLAGGVETEEGCCLGANCSIMSGVKLGRHCLVGMGAVVLKSAPEKSALAGNPVCLL
jgi:acetyltransferase-like isoleucine patch superfamily enzyme